MESDPDQSSLSDDRARSALGGVGAVLLGAAAWGSTGTAAHFAPAGAGSASIGAARIVLGGAVLLGLALRSRHRDGLRALLAAGTAARAWLALAAVAVAGYQLCFFAAVRLTGVAIGTVVAIGSAPVFTGLISRLTGGPALTPRWMTATAAAIGGCAVLVTGGKAAGVQLGGVGLALLAGACYAIYAVTAGRLIAGGNSQAVVMGVLFGAAAVVLTPVLAATSPGWLLSGRGLAVTAYLGLVTTAAAYLLYGYGLRTVAVPTAVTLGLAEPVVAALLGVIVLGERLGAPALAGLVLVGLAIVILTSAGRRINARAPG
ncbi:MAG TPA: EamA family transporter [Streptosporangiaceae bacterium]|nr:EamA family transporter [Streptosporangiaceae bacterium]